MLSIVMKCRTSLEMSGQAELTTGVGTCDLCKEVSRVRFQARKENYRTLRESDILSSPYSFPYI